MPSDYGYPLPPSSQRPQMFNRVAIDEPKELIRAKDEEGLERVGVEQAKVKVVTESREVLDNRFPTESQVERFRGNTEGRELKEVPASLPISRLPKQVQAFNSFNARSGEMSELSFAELAAQGLSKPKLTLSRPDINVGRAARPVSAQEAQTIQAPEPQYPSINGSGEIAARFDSIEEQIRMRALDEFEVFRPGGSESQRVSLEAAQADAQTRERFNNEVRQEFNQEFIRNEDRVIERQANEVRIDDRNRETRRTEINANERAIESQQQAEQVVERKTSEAPISREPGAPVDTRGEPLSSQEQAEVRRLERRDLEVRSHEQAHAAAGGSHVRGGMQLDYTTGPDGRRYATDGEVSVDLSSERTPEATANKMQQIQRAALAPANPSGADRAVAAVAARRELEAQAEIQALQARDREAIVKDQESGETASERVAVEQSAQVESREGSDHFAGAQAVGVDQNFTPRTSGIEQQSLEAYEASFALSAPAESSRPVPAPAKKLDIKEQSPASVSPRSESTSAQYDQALEKALSDY